MDCTVDFMGRGAIVVLRQSRIMAHALQRAMSCWLARQSALALRFRRRLDVEDAILADLAWLFLVVERHQFEQALEHLCTQASIALLQLCNPLGCALKVDYSTPCRTAPGPLSFAQLATVPFNVSTAIFTVNGTVLRADARTIGAELRAELPAECLAAFAITYPCATSTQSALMLIRV